MSRGIDPVEGETAQPAPRLTIPNLETCWLLMLFTPSRPALDDKGKLTHSHVNLQKNMSLFLFLTELETVARIYFHWRHDTSWAKPVCGRERDGRLFNVQVAVV